MNGDEERHVHEHISAEGVSLRDYFEALLGALEGRLNERARTQKEAVDAALLAAKEAVNAALAAAEKAVVTARTAQERVNEKQNEFRQTLVDQNATFMPRETFEAAQKESNRRIENLEAFSQQNVGQSRGSAAANALQSVDNTFRVYVGLFVVAVAALVVSVVTVIHP
jgi:dsDNA-specific endonuclease/ATPase MutS2